MEAKDLKQLVASFLLLLLTCTVGEAQKKKLPANDPGNCPYCRNEPKLMQDAGLVSHGGFQFGTTNTAGVDALLAASDIRWIESLHFEIGIALGPYKVNQKEKKKIRAELTELAELLPEVNPKAKVLDPWLRVHLYAMRAEKLWQQFLDVMHVEEGDFPDGIRRRREGDKYMGEGPYLGMKGKYEVLVVPTEGVQVAFLRDQFGLQIRKSQRWHITDIATMIVVINTEEDMKSDEALHGHMAFNLAINMLNGFKHYSYDTPVWLTEGLAHYFERSINPKFNSYDSAEGSIAEVSRKSDWDAEVRKLIQSKKAPRMAEMAALRTYAEFDLRHHFASWSMIRFLIEEHGEAFACLNDRIHGIVSDEGIADGSDMQNKHREFFRECLGMNYAQFDAAWKVWATTKK